MDFKKNERIIKNKIQRKHLLNERFNTVSI
jgi:hypothetical protein